jgi:hypothetical protein
MYLEVFPNGTKSWRMKYLVGGKEKRVVFGVYPPSPKLRPEQSVMKRKGCLLLVAILYLCSNYRKGRA